MGKEKYYYLLVNKRGNPVVINAQLPIFWRKKVAVMQAEIYKCNVARVEIKLAVEVIQNINR